MSEAGKRFLCRLTVFWIPRGQRVFTLRPARYGTHTEWWLGPYMVTVWHKKEEEE